LSIISYWEGCCGQIISEYLEELLMWVSKCIFIWYAILFLPSIHEFKDVTSLFSHFSDTKKYYVNGKVRPVESILEMALGGR
jgi:hypothetical protein